MSEVNQKSFGRRSFIGIFLTVAIFPNISIASTFDDIANGISEITLLRGTIKNMADGATEALRHQLSIFFDEKIDPIISRIDSIISQRIDQAIQGALDAIGAIKNALNQIINNFFDNLNGFADSFFININKTINLSFERIEAIICKIKPGDVLPIDIGPFRSDTILVKRPKKTYCYRDFPESASDPSSARFNGWEFYRGELCELELTVQKINPEEPGSIKKIISAYDAIAKYADSARCTAPTDSAKVEMAQKFHQYNQKAEFFRQLIGVSK